MDNSALELTAALLREAIVSGNDARQKSAPSDARLALSSLSSAVRCLNGSSAGECTSSALPTLQLALACLRVVRNACACGRDAQSAVAEAGGIGLCGDLLRYLARDALLRCDLPPELAELTDPELRPAPSSHGDSAGWVQTSKLATKASWQVLSNIAAADFDEKTLACSWQLFQPAPSGDSKRLAPAVSEAIVAWCRADSTLLPVIGWLLHLLVTKSNGTDAASMGGPARRLRDLSSNAALLQCLCRLSGGASSGAAGEASSSDVEWLIGIIAAFRRAGLFHAAYVACRAASSSPSSLSPSASRFPVSFEQLVLLRALVAHLEDDEAESAKARSRGELAPAGASSALHPGDAAALLNELVAICRFLTPPPRTGTGGGDPAAGGAGADTALRGSGSSSAASAPEEGADAIAKEWCRRAVSLLCGVLADHLAAATAAAADGVVPSMGDVPLSVSSAGASDGSVDAAAGGAGVLRATAPDSALAASSGPLVSPASSAISTGSPTREASIALAHVLAAHHAPVHRAPDAGGPAGGAGAGAPAGTSFGGKRARSQAASGAPGDFSADAPGGGLSGLTDGFRLLALALTADPDAAESLAERCPGLVPLSLYHSQKMEAERPTLREWAVLCLRFLLSHSETARRIMRELQASMEVAKAKADAESCTSTGLSAAP